MSFGRVVMALTFESDDPGSNLARATQENVCFFCLLKKDVIILGTHVSIND